MSEEIRKKLNEKGIEGAMAITYGEDRMIIDFKTPNGFLGMDGESFSEKTVFDFVATSYASSCLTLLSRMKEYYKAEDYRKKDQCSYRFLPAMFCFRHYIELKLKYLYMCYHQEEYLGNHNLRKLCEDLKKDNLFDMGIFDEPIEYIEKIEKFIPNGKVDESYFRYLANKNFQFQEHLEIPFSDIEKIENYIREIEFRVSQVRMNVWLLKTMNNTNATSMETEKK